MYTNYITKMEYDATKCTEYLLHIKSRLSDTMFVTYSTFWCMYNLTGMKKSIIRLWHELALSFFVQDLHPSFFYCVYVISRRDEHEEEERKSKRKYFEHSCNRFYFLRQVSKQALIFNRHNKKFFLLFHLVSPFRRQHSNLMRPNKFS